MFSICLAGTSLPWSRYVVSSIPDSASGRSLEGSGSAEICEEVTEVGSSPGSESSKEP